MARAKRGESVHSRAARRSAVAPSQDIPPTAQDNNVNAKLASLAVRNSNNNSNATNNKKPKPSSSTKRKKKLAALDRALQIQDKLKVKIHKSNQRAKIIQSRRQQHQHVDGDGQ